MDNKYKYSFEKTSNYCYANSDVLINKLNIKIEEELFLKERQFVAYRSGEIEKSPITGDFDFEHLKQIHKHLFQDVYNWAGEIRTCNIAKTDLFCLAQHIESYGADIFAKLKKQNYFLEKSYSDKIYSLVELLSD
ncbi:MAG: Fic family protein, partial [Lachnospiraceae bacterium]|nr:Fic family protein [Lachnospiraceae bacterium]